MWSAMQFLLDLQSIASHIKCFYTNSTLSLCSAAMRVVLGWYYRSWHGPCLWYPCCTDWCSSLNPGREREWAKRNKKQTCRDACYVNDDGQSSESDWCWLASELLIRSLIAVLGNLACLTSACVSACCLVSTRMCMCSWQAEYVKICWSCQATIDVLALSLICFLWLQLCLCLLLAIPYISLSAACGCACSKFSMMQDALCDHEASLFQLCLNALCYKDLGVVM